MKSVANQSGRLVVELLLVMPFLVALVLVSSEIARFVRCKQAAAVLTSEVGKAAYRSCGEIVDFDNTNNGFVDPVATATRIRICLRDVMQRDGTSGFNNFSASLAAYLNLQNLQIRVGVFDGTGNTPFTPISSYPTTGGPASRFGTATGTLQPSANFLANKGRFVVAEVFFPVSGMMGFSRAFGLSSIQANGQAYDAALF